MRRPQRWLQTAGRCSSAGAQQLQQLPARCQAGLTVLRPGGGWCSGHTRALPAWEVAVRLLAAASAAAAATPGATSRTSPSGALLVRSRKANSSAPGP